MPVVDAEDDGDAPGSYDDEAVGDADAVSELVAEAEGSAGASATPRKSVLAGACAIGVNTDDAGAGATPGTNCTTTFPPVPTAPLPVQMYNTYSPFNSGSTNPVMARAPVIVAPVMPLAVMYVNLVAGQVAGRV